MCVCVCHPCMASKWQPVSGCAEPHTLFISVQLSSLPVFPICWAAPKWKTHIKREYAQLSANKSDAKIMINVLWSSWKGILLGLRPQILYSALFHTFDFLIRFCCRCQTVIVLWLLFMSLLGGQIKKLSPSLRPTAASFPCPLQSHYVPVFSTRSLSLSLGYDAVLWAWPLNICKFILFFLSFICCKLYCSHSKNRKM